MDMDDGNTPLERLELLYGTTDVGNNQYEIISFFNERMGLFEHTTAELQQRINDTLKLYDLEGIREDNCAYTPEETLGECECGLRDLDSIRSLYQEGKSYLDSMMIIIYKGEKLGLFDDNLGNHMNSLKDGLGSCRQSDNGIVEGMQKIEIGLVNRINQMWDKLLS